MAFLSIRIFNLPPHVPPDIFPRNRERDRHKHSSTGSWYFPSALPAIKLLHQVDYLLKYMKIANMKTTIQIGKKIISCRSVSWYFTFYVA
jgi:hypothetical protein